MLASFRLRGMIAALAWSVWLSQLMTFAPRFAVVAAQASAAIVISEFRTRGPAGGNDEFIELYNNSDVPVNIGNWKISGSNSAGDASTRLIIAPDTVLPARGHFLAARSGAYSGAVAANQTYATGIGDNGGLALLDSTNTIVDQVGLSANSAYQEGATLQPLTTNANRSYERKPGGAGGSTQDTGDNAADFLIASPSDPQNLDSPPTPGASGALTLSVGDATIIEGASGNAALGFAVSLSAPAPFGGVTFNIATADNSASAVDNDYQPQSLIAQTIPEGATSYIFNVLVIGDAQVEFDEAFFVDVSNVSGASVSDAQGAGTIVNDDFAIIPIHDIQGGANTSPLANTVVTTTGIVTGRKNNGFFIQTPDNEADADANTSQGIFVFTAGAPPASASYGNLVNVTGTVIEFKFNSEPLSLPLTQLSGSPTINVISTNNTLPAPITLAASDTSPAGSFEQLEKYEGMRVRVESLIAASPTDGFVNERNATASSSGIFYGVIAGIARPLREPGVEVLDPLPTGAPANVPRFDANPERLRVDSDAQPGATILNVTAGAVIANLTGPLDYNLRSYTILPDPPTITAPGPVISNLATARAVPAPSINELTVGSFNAERFFDTVDAPDIDDPVLTPSAFNKRLNKASLVVRNVLRTPDVLGVIEFENLSALQALADKINADHVAAGNADPAYQAYLMEGNDIGGIDVGFLVKSARVTVLDVTQAGKDAIYLNPGTNLPETLNDRPPLILRASVQSIAGNAVAFTVIVNHLRSLNGVDGDTAGARRVRAKRRAQAEFLANLIQARQTAQPAERIVSVGDYNAFQFNDGLIDVLGTIKGQPTPADQVVLASSDLVDPDLFNASELAPAHEQYSFVFDGNAQTLDHILVSANFRSNLSRFAHARSNADFPEIFRNDPLRPERLSDHDAAVAYFTLAEEVSTRVKIVSAGLSYSRLNRTYNGGIVLINRHAQSIIGPLQIVLDDLTPGVSLVNRTGEFQNDSYITVPQSLAPGEALRIPVRFRNPSHERISYAVKVYAGSF